MNEIPDLPEADGTYMLNRATGAWDPVTLDHGYFAATTQGEHDYKAKPEGCIGRWTDPEDGKVYIDHTFYVPDRKDAEEIGREHKQLAIWDIAAGEEIRL